MKKFFKGCLVFIVAIVVLGVIIGVIVGGGDEESSTTENSSGSSSEEKATEETMVGIGEELKVGDVVFKVNGTSTATNVGGEYGVKSQGTFLILDVMVRNEGSEAITVDSSFFKLKVNGKEYEADSSAGIYANEQADFFLTSLNPDLSLEGKVVFDVSDEVINAEEQILEVQTGYWGTEMGQIQLK